MWVIAVGFLHLSTEENLNNVKQFASSEYDAESFVEKKENTENLSPSLIAACKSKFFCKVMFLTVDK